MKLIKNTLLLSVLALTVLVSCSDSASVASRNLSKAADEFEIYRRVVFYNGITDSYILSVEGYCSISDSGHKVSVTIKTKDGEFLKHNLGLSDNVTYFSEQLKSENISEDRYRVIFKPSTLIPTLEVK